MAAHLLTTLSSYQMVDGVNLVVSFSSFSLWNDNHEWVVLAAGVSRKGSRANDAWFMAPTAIN
ncbi:hypothetical protein Csa_005615 [Cucumis sativus]|uniref:Uncharacterized protein n=1 Tax=Cucumis sativus TaxID=3659 RepID=A0A0A0KAS9_CUCSA|nr:hypothetical protein Csa_005615 [Cucumis sativus]